MRTKIKWTINLKQWLKRQPEQRLLIILSFVVGLGSGLAAVVLKQLIYLIGGFLTGWMKSPGDNIFLFLFPGIGMFLSLLVVRYAVKDDLSHGVTKALFAISKNNSKIKAHNMWSSMLTSSLTIGFGGSVGAEAPIVYTGAAIGSNVAKGLGLSYRDMTILLGCGAAGAIAGIFKAPMAGILFTLEILLLNISMISILPLLISSISATIVSYLFLGKEASVTSVVGSGFTMDNIPYYLVLGIFCGLLSLYFLRTSFKVEDRIRRIKNPFKRWAICAVLIGLLIFLFPPLFGEGYTSLASILQGESENISHNFLFSKLLNVRWIIPIYFIIVLILKVFAMSFTNAGGGVGGTFGPTLVVGGIAGFIIARSINLIGFHAIPETNFTLVGMAGLMAGVMQAPMTSIFLIAEITGGYSLLVPLIIVSTISFATIRVFEHYSIYSKRLAKSGELLTHDSDKAVLILLKTCNLIEKDFTKMRMDQTLGDLVKAIAESKRNLFPVVDDNDILKGFISLNDVRGMMFNKSLYDQIKVSTLMEDVPVLVYCKESMESVMKKFDMTGAWNLPVVDKDKKYLGFVSKSKIFSAYRKRLQEVSHE